MSLLVLSYPAISQKDFNWIQKIRAEHDRLHYKIVDPHFTMVFAVDGMGLREFIEHIKKQVPGFKKIAFVLRGAIVVKDTFSEYTYVFLVPEEGYNDMVKLHDELYGGKLSSELRLDIPFIPHINIGNSIDPQDCKKLVDRLNQQSFAIKGWIETLDVVKYEDNRVKTIKQIKLV
jgi:hypothetical protein